MKPAIPCLLFAAFQLAAAFSAEDAAPKPAEGAAGFRTDESADESLPWFQLADGEFPPEGSSHSISGELIGVDHVERKFVLRADRTDKQNRSHFDLPLGAQMLPYGAVFYHGAPACLTDIPVGTHLRGQFYLRHPDDESLIIESWHRRVTPEKDFTRCLRLEDDFSFHQRQNQLWRVDAVDFAAKKLTATLLQSGKPAGEAKIFDLPDSARVWKGRGFESLEILAPGQQIQLNITWATLYGPGRIREIWLDEASRGFASAHQMKKHHIHVRQRGLPGWVDEVDNHERIVTVTFFANVDPKLFESLVVKQEAGLAVSRESLVTYDPVNDRKRGPILEKRQIPAVPGCSGVQIRMQPGLMLEGYRPKRIVRVYPAGWPVIALPKEEQWFGRD